MCEWIDDSAQGCTVFPGRSVLPRTLQEADTSLQFFHSRKQCGQRAIRSAGTSRSDREAGIGIVIFALSRFGGRANRFRPVGVDYEHERLNMVRRYSLFETGS